MLPVLRNEEVNAKMEPPPAKKARKSRKGEGAAPTSTAPKKSRAKKGSTSTAAVADVPANSDKGGPGPPPRPNTLAIQSVRNLQGHTESGSCCENDPKEILMRKSLYPLPLVPLFPMALTLLVL